MVENELSGAVIDVVDNFLCETFNRPSRDIDEQPVVLRAIRVTRWLEFFRHVAGIPVYQARQRFPWGVASGPSLLWHWASYRDIGPAELAIIPTRMLREVLKGQHW